MEDRNLIAEIVEELDDKGKFFLGLVVLFLLHPQLQEELEKAYDE